MSQQLLRYGTAIGALSMEAQQAFSRNDFIYKFSIAQKEANESLYWIELLHRSGYLNQESYAKLYTPCLTLIKIITSILKSTKANIASKKQPPTNN